MGKTKVIVYETIICLWQSSWSTIELIQCSAQCWTQVSERKEWSELLVIWRLQVEQYRSACYCFNHGEVWSFIYKPFKPPVSDARQQFFFVRITGTLIIRCHEAEEREMLKIKQYPWVSLNYIVSFLTMIKVSSGFQTSFFSSAKWYIIFLHILWFTWVLF